MITDSYDIETKPLIHFEDFYGPQAHIAEICLVVFSRTVYEHLLDTFACEKVAEITACNGNTPIYRMNYEGRDILFYLTKLGSTMASSCCAEVNWVTGADKFIMFGSCGSLDAEKTKGKFIIPTEAYRGEGCSYYFAPPADYITIRNSRRMAAFFEEMKIPYVMGKAWTAEAMIRETVGLARKRREEGCIAVEMELAGVQAVADFFGFELYDFLEAGDVLGESDYEMEGLAAANHNLGKLYIALKIASRL